MKTYLWLRTASVLMLLFAAGHSAGGRDAWSPVGETDVLRAMRSFSFNAGGSTRTYFDFYMGFGWTLSVFMLLQAVLLWQLASMAKANPASTRPMILSFLIATVASAIISWKLIIAIPVIFSAVIAVVLGVAYATAR